MYPGSAPPPSTTRGRTLIREPSTPSSNSRERNRAAVSAGETLPKPAGRGRGLLYRYRQSKRFRGTRQNDGKDDWMVFNAHTCRHVINDCIKMAQDQFSLSGHCLPHCHLCNSQTPFPGRVTTVRRSPLSSKQEILRPPQTGSGRNIYRCKVLKCLKRRDPE